MKALILLSFIAFGYSCYGQPIINFTSKNLEDGVELYASNQEYCDVSVVMDFKLGNLRPSTGDSTTYVIPGRVKNFKVVKLKKIKDNACYNYKYQFKSYLGNINVQQYDTLYEYDLPYKKGDSAKVDQGYNGIISHANEKALDFNLPEGTAVVAARDGIVTQLVQYNTAHCNKPACMQYNNYIVIAHNDGTFANYAHLKCNSAKVKIGDSIKQGSVIALSGNTGYTNGAHLHFECYLPSKDKNQTIETYFKIGDANEIAVLEEGETYYKNY